MSQAIPGRNRDQRSGRVVARAQEQVRIAWQSKRSFQAWRPGGSHYGGIGVCKCGRSGSRPNKERGPRDNESVGQGPLGRWVKAATRQVKASDVMVVLLFHSTSRCRYARSNRARKCQSNPIQSNPASVLQPRVCTTLHAPRSMHYARHRLHSTQFPSALLSLVPKPVTAPPLRPLVQRRCEAPSLRQPQRQTTDNPKTTHYLHRHPPSCLHRLVPPEEAKRIMGCIAGPSVVDTSLGRIPFDQRTTGVQRHNSPITHLFAHLLHKPHCPLSSCKPFVPLPLAL
jgi:hypothetical protein